MAAVLEEVVVEGKELGVVAVRVEAALYRRVTVHRLKAEFESTQPSRGHAT